MENFKFRAKCVVFVRASFPNWHWNETKQLAQHFCLKVQTEQRVSSEQSRLSGCGFVLEASTLWLCDYWIYWSETQMMLASGLQVKKIRLQPYWWPLATIRLVSGQCPCIIFLCLVRVIFKFEVVFVFLFFWQSTCFPPFFFFALKQTEEEEKENHEPNFQTLESSRLQADASWDPRFIQSFYLSRRMLEFTRGESEVF